MDIACDPTNDHLRQPGQLMFTSGSASEAGSPLTTCARPNAPSTLGPVGFSSPDHSEFGSFPVRKPVLVIQ